MTDMLAEALGRAKEAESKASASSSAAPDLQHPTVVAHIAEQRQFAVQDAEQKLSQQAGELETLRAKLQTAEAAAAAAAAGGGGAGSGEGGEGGLSAAALRDVMQDIYGKACDVFDPDANDGAEAKYSAQDVVKKLRAVLKKVTAAR